jgi:hypothetical protein
MEEYANEPFIDIIAIKEDGGPVETVRSLG